jgi:hypothetical protein
VEGGKDLNNELLYVSRVEYNGRVYTANVGEHLPAACLAFSDMEVAIDVRTRLTLWLAIRISDVLVVGLRNVVPQLNGCTRWIRFAGFLDFLFATAVWLYLVLPRSHAGQFKLVTRFQIEPSC